MMALTKCVFDKYSYPAVSLWPVKTDDETGYCLRERNDHVGGGQTEQKDPFPFTRVP